LKYIFDDHIVKSISILINDIRYQAIAFKLDGTNWGSMTLRIALLVMALISCACASPDEASGIVLRVVDGDTFEVQGFGLVKLADIDVPEMGTIEGVHAREYALENLLGVQVFLDIDDRRGKRADGATACIAYLANSNGTPNIHKNFNSMVLTAGFARIKDDPANEFDPTIWR
jgi:micrococcal nuclease